MTSHLHPDCRCSHRPGLPCDTSCPVHGTNDGPGLYNWVNGRWVKAEHTQPGVPHVVSLSVRRDPP